MDSCWFKRFITWPVRLCAICMPSKRYMHQSTNSGFECDRMHNRMDIDSFGQSAISIFIFHLDLLPMVVGFSSQCTTSKSMDLFKWFETKAFRCSFQCFVVVFPPFVFCIVCVNCSDYVCHLDREPLVLMLVLPLGYLAATNRTSKLSFSNLNQFPMQLHYIIELIMQWSAQLHECICGCDFE